MIVLSISEFDFVYRIDSVVRGYFEVKTDLFESFELLKNLFKDQIFYILGLKTSFFDECIAESKDVEALQDVVSLEEFKTKLEHFFVFMRDRLNASEAIFVEVASLDDLSKVVFCDSFVLDMQFSFKDKNFSFLSDVVYLEIEKKLVDISLAKIVFEDWSDYYAERCFEFESGKEPEMGSDFFEAIADFPHFEVIKDKKEVLIMGSGKFVAQGLTYHFIDPKVSGTLEWERKSIL